MAQEKMTKEEIEKIRQEQMDRLINGGYDILLMNPPYDKSTHLQFLEAGVETAKNVVSVQPTRWLEEVVGKEKSTSNYNKYKDGVSKHIKDLEIISSEDAKHMFDITLPGNVGIYVCDEKGGYDYDNLSSNSIINKIADYVKNNLCNLELNKKNGYRVRVPFISGGKCNGNGDRGPTITRVPVKNIVFTDGKYNGHWWYEYYAKNKYSKTTPEITSSIQFNSELEGHNFAKQFETDFVRYAESCLITDVHICNKKILWMGNAINPRTGKKGYLSEWTDDDFNKFFELTDEEISMYKTFMNDFRAKREAWLKSKNKK